jgi:hypothetical protein
VLTMASTDPDTDDERKRAERKVIESLKNLPPESRKNILLLSEITDNGHVTPNTKKRKTRDSPAVSSTPWGSINSAMPTSPYQTNRGVVPPAQNLGTPGQLKNKSQYKVDVVYVHNNIPSGIRKNPIKRAEILTKCMPENSKISDIKIKQTGEIILFPTTPEDYNRLLKKDKWKDSEYGPLTPGLPTQKVIPQKCSHGYSCRRDQDKVSWRWFHCYSC